MMQITAELHSMNSEQREALAAFILNFPTITAEPIPAEEEPDNLAVIPAFTVASEEIEPEEAFSASPVPPAPPAAGPVLVVPAAPATDTAATLDKAGFPWDERIHASSRAHNADGTWRKKRGVSDGLVTEVESQLRSLMALPASPAAPPPPPPAPSVVPAAPAPSAITADGKAAYIQLISNASAAIVAKQITQAQVNSAVAAAGVPSLPLLANRLDLVPQVAATIETLIAANVAVQ